MHARIQKVLSESFLVDGDREYISKYHHKRANIGPLVKRGHLNDVSLACRKFPAKNIECWLGSHAIFQGIGPVLLGNPTALRFFRGSGPPVRPWYDRLDVQMGPTCLVYIHS